MCTESAFELHGPVYMVLISILNPQLVNIGSQYSYSSEDQTEFLVVVSREFDAPPVAEDGVCAEERVSLCTVAVLLVVSYVSTLVLCLCGCTYVQTPQASSHVQTCCAMFRALRVTTKPLHKYAKWFLQKSMKV